MTLMNLNRCDSKKHKIARAIWQISTPIHSRTYIESSLSHFSLQYCQTMNTFEMQRFITRSWPRAMIITPRNQPILLTRTIRARSGECTNSKKESDHVPPSESAQCLKRMEALDASNKKASEELSRLIEEKKRREQEWPPEPPKWYVWRS